jgi:hypothetical protein
MSQTAARIYKHFIVSEEAKKADLLPGAKVPARAKMNKTFISFSLNSIGGRGPSGPKTMDLPTASREGAVGSLGTEP